MRLEAQEQETPLESMLAVTGASTLLSGHPVVHEHQLSFLTCKGLE